MRFTDSNSQDQLLADLEQLNAYQRKGAVAPKIHVLRPLANTLLAKGQALQAIPYLREILALSRFSLSPHMPPVRQALLVLAKALVAAANYGEEPPREGDLRREAELRLEALHLFSEAAQLDVQEFGAVKAATLATSQELLGCLASLERWSEVESLTTTALLNESLESGIKVTLLSHLTTALSRQKRYSEAANRAQQVADLLEAVHESAVIPQLHTVAGLWRAAGELEKMSAVETRRRELVKKHDY